MQHFPAHLTLAKKLSLVLLLCLGMVWCDLAQAVEPEHPAELETGLESRLVSFENGLLRHEHGHEFAVTLGLGWTPVWVVTVHAQLEGGWFVLLDDEASYRYHNRSLSMRHAGELGIGVLVDLHPESKIVSFRMELGARSYFVTGRAGIFVLHAGAGIGIQPFWHRQDTLRSVRFGVSCRFHLYDEFSDIFELDRKLPELGLQVGWMF